ncbi:MAG: plasmid pRiA4b ORF-3 family protein [Leptolyngbyaceae cyanobacterium RU_5_1]|nr:plasmid pRiA4b ORF-3 family protein [Leptolyngbyaceae cyanobacterium RU_5_1]
MTLDLDRIDRITDYDDAINALEDFVGDLVGEFVKSSEGKTYLAAHPEMAEFVGGWIDQLLYFGYAYQSVTLPRMTKPDVEAIVTQLFPQKVSLLDPEEANTTIPELTAFWQFLKREYKHPHASKILSFLKKIQPTFKELMNDPSQFGIAKSFFSAGMAAGFDMTSEAGLQAFQTQYNQGIQDASTNTPLLPSSTSMLGTINSLPSGAAGAMPPPAELLAHLNAIATGLRSGEQTQTSENILPPTPVSVAQELRSTMWQKVANELPPLSDQAIAALTQQPITATEPGTILRDFQTLLDLIGDTGVPVSGTYHLLSQSLLADLNQRLSHPIQLDLKRPVQKSYASINGLYLLLRVTGLGQIISTGKKHQLVLNSKILQSWNSLNLTERYFTLLESWMIRADEEMLGERRSALNEGTKCIQFWPSIPDKGQTFSKYAEQQSLSYCPELHNLALLNVFGFLQIESGKPEAGKGWRVKKIQRSPFGDAMMQVMVRAFMEQGMEWESETNPTIPFGELKPALQPYFPEWQTTLTVLQQEFRAGVFVFKISLGKAWRRIAISSDMTLFALSRLILQSVDFDTDHLDMFKYRNQNGRTVEIHHPYSEESPATDEVQIGDLPLAEGASMTYIFDFGDWWEFEVQLETIQIDQPRSRYTKILEHHSQAPQQYPDWDEED